MKNVNIIRVIATGALVALAGCVSKPSEPNY
jgi:hypothetical protein